MAKIQASFFRLFVLGVALSPLLTNPSFAQEDAKKKRVTQVETAPVEMRQIEEVVEAIGTSKAARSVKLMPLSDGVVRSIHFEEAQQVKAGDVLLRLDDDIQRADLAEAQAMLKEAEQALARTQSLRKKDTVAIAMVDKTISEAEVARAKRDRAARYLSDRAITAPFDGRIGFSDVEVGTHIKEGETIATLDDLSNLQVEFSLAENLFGSVHVGMNVIADASAFPEQTFRGQIAAIDTRVDAASRSFKVRALIPNEGGKLPAGMFMHLSLVLDASQALSIPEEAVMVDGSEASVFVVQDKEGELVVAKRLVKIGRRSFGWVEVSKGLEEGERVVVRGIQKVKNGSSVREAGKDQVKK